MEYVALIAVIILFGVVSKNGINITITVNHKHEAPPQPEVKEGEYNHSVGDPEAVAYFNDIYKGV